MMTFSQALSASAIALSLAGLLPSFGRVGSKSPFAPPPGSRRAPDYGLRTADKADVAWLSAIVEKPCRTGADAE